MNLSLNPLSAVLPAAQLRTYAKGQIILHEGDNTDDLFIIKEGTVKVHDIDEQGNDKILHILKQPAVFPLGSLLSSDQETTPFYTPITRAEIYAVSSVYVSKQMSKNTNLATYMLRHFAREAHELLVRISSMEKTTVRDKLIATLKFLAVHHATIYKNGWRRVCFPISHQLLADMMGVTRERTTKVMQSLQEGTLIRYPRSRTLEINFDKLVTL